VKARWLAPLVIALAAGCVSLPGDDDDHDHDDDRPKSEERARSYCVEEAKSRGWRVEDVGRIEKVGKKQYEVKLRVRERKKQEKSKGGDNLHVLCRYDDKGRNAALY